MRLRAKQTIRALIGTGAATALAFGLAGGASAADGTPFAQQARDAGITAEQAQGMQARIDQQMRQQPGGQQTGLNQITWDERGTRLTLPLPGESQARAIGEAPTAKGKANCPRGNACLYEDTGYEGRRVEEYRCGKFRDLTSEDFGHKASSLHNNQSGKATTRLYQWRNGEWDRIRSEPAGSSVSDLDDANDRAGGWSAC